MRHCSVPTDLLTLALAEPGQELEIRHILCGAYLPRHRLQHGDRVLCRDVTSRGIVIDMRDGECVHIPFDCARYIQVQPTAFGVLNRNVRNERIKP